MNTKLVVIPLILVLSVSGVGHAADEQTNTPQKYAVFGFAFTYSYDTAPMELKVCAVRSGSSADSSGLRKDDVIEEVDGLRKFKNSFEVLEYILTKRPGEKLELRVRRGQTPLTVSVVGVLATEEQAAAIRETMRFAKEEAENRRQ